MKVTPSVVLLLLLLLLPLPLAAQQGWMLDLAVGHVTYETIGARVGTASAMAGVRHEAGTSAWSYLYGGMPLQQEGIAWGAGGTGRRVAREIGQITLGADLGAHLLGYRDTELAASGGAVTLEVLPTLGVRRGALAVEFRSGLLQHTDFYEDLRLTRRIHDSGVRAALLLQPTLRVQADARYTRAPEGSYPYLGGGVDVGAGSVVGWAFAGRWLSDTFPTVAYGAGLSWSARERWELRAGWQQEASNPLYWNPPRRGWNLQLSRRLGRVESRAAPLSVARGADGRVAIQLPVSETSSAPSVVGDFTEWRPVPMTREGEVWVVRLNLSSGVYRYGFQDAQGQWFLPASLTNRVDDGMGGESALLIVP